MIIINSCPSLGRRNVVSDDKKSTLVLVGRVLFLCSNALELFLVVTLIVSRDTFKVKKKTLSGQFDYFPVLYSPKLKAVRHPT